MRTHSLAAVTCFFNPCGYKKPVDNYDAFASLLDEQRVPLFTIELAIGDDPFYLAASINTRRVRVPAGNVMWFKERLFNLAVPTIPSRYTKLAFLDSDIEFDDDNWAERTASLLDSKVLAQPFSQGLWLNEDGDASKITPGVLSQFVQGQGSLTPDTFMDSHPGFAWAGQRWLWEEHGFFDMHVLGGGDRLLALAATNMVSHSYVSEKLSQGLREAFMAWAGPFQQAVTGKMGELPGRVIHMWHGDRPADYYLNRHRILIRHDFDPIADLRRDVNNVYIWAGNKPELAAEVHQYFCNEEVNAA